MVTPGRLQRAPQARRGAPAAPEVRVRDDRAGEGDRDHQVADPSLPVPARAARILRELLAESLTAEADRVRARGAAGGGPRGRRVGP